MVHNCNKVLQTEMRKGASWQKKQLKEKKYQTPLCEDDGDERRKIEECMKRGRVDKKILKCVKKH